MSALHAILLAVRMAHPDASPISDWSISLAAPSGWGGRPGIYVDSTGRNVAMNPQNGGPPGWYCKELPLDEVRVRAIAKHILRIPPDVLTQGGLQIHDSSCADEPINVMFLTIQGREYHFSYSQLKFCRAGQEVPKWLSRLVDALWVRYHEIEQCKLTPLEAEPRT
jgi:hypothetical protein